MKFSLSLATLAVYLSAVQLAAVTAAPSVQVGMEGMTEAASAYSGDPLPPPPPVTPPPPPPPPPPPRPLPAPSPCDQARRNAVPFYRLFKASVHDHFYTIHGGVRSAGHQTGFVDQGTAGKVLSCQLAGSVPLYRLFNPKINDHFHTTSMGSVSSNIKTWGWQMQGVDGYVFPQGNMCPGLVPLYALYAKHRIIPKKYPQGTVYQNKVAVFDHIYTTSVTERSNLFKAGYVSQGIVGYVYP
ncbi:hypothetical protein HGRIS_011082 [Hohenbuehelia grisea]|uniref:DUF5648 domain-containing protein n=1 Tax=Hohenbuehelia grisea TaxID=104357 RepID=A0ABR3IYU8_9AGAR